VAWNAGNRQMHTRRRSVSFGGEQGRRCPQDAGCRREPTAYSKGKLLSTAPNRSAGIGIRCQHDWRQATTGKNLTGSDLVPAILRAQRGRTVPLRCGNCWIPKRALGSRLRRECTTSCSLAGSDRLPQRCGNPGPGPRRCRPRRARTSPAAAGREGVHSPLPQGQGHARPPLGRDRQARASPGRCGRAAGGVAVDGHEGRGRPVHARHHGRLGRRPRRRRRPRSGGGPAGPAHR
jgi:hypothetical protein